VQSLKAVCLFAQLLDLRQIIEGDQRLYVQWAEEKLSLANIAVDLINQHRLIVDQDIANLETDLKVPILTRNCPPLPKGCFSQM